MSVLRSEKTLQGRSIGVLQSKGAFLEIVLDLGFLMPMFGVGS